MSSRSAIDVNWLQHFTASDIVNSPVVRELQAKRLSSSPNRYRDLTSHRIFVSFWNSFCPNDYCSPSPTTGSCIGNDAWRIVKQTSRLWRVFEDAQAILHNERVFREHRSGRPVKRKEGADFRREAYAGHDAGQPLDRQAYVRGGPGLGPSRAVHDIRANQSISRDIRRPRSMVKSSQTTSCSHQDAGIWNVHSEATFNYMPTQDWQSVLKALDDPSTALNTFEDTRMANTPWQPSCDWFVLGSHM